MSAERPDQVPDTLAPLAPEELKRVGEVRRGIDASRPSSVMEFGAAAQVKISEFADRVLSGIRSRDTAHVGNLLDDLMARLRELRVEDLSGAKRGFLDRLPFLGGAVDRARHFMERYEDLGTRVLKIVQDLETARAMLQRDVELLDLFFEENAAYFKEVSLHILAGEQALAEIQETELPAARKAAESSDDPFLAMRYKEMAHFASRLEKKLHDLRLSRAIVLQAGPQIRLVQGTNRELAEKIQTSILNTIPLWKHQMVIAIALLRQRQVRGLQEGISETTRALLEKNAELLKEGVEEAAREVERGVVDIESVKKVNADLISTIEETVKIQREGRARRKLAAEELQRMEQELKERLAGIRSSLEETGG